MRSAPVVRAFLALAVIAASLFVALTQSARLGLDLRGGTQIVLETRSSDTVTANAASTDRALGVLRNRIDALGVTDPTVTRSGERRIIIELPGVQDPREAAEVVGRTAQLTFHPVVRAGDPPSTDPKQKPPKLEDGQQAVNDEDGAPIIIGPAALTGDGVGDAEAVTDPSRGAAWFVTIDFRGSGGKTWGDLTGKAACSPAGDPARRVAIVLDKEVISSPQVDPGVACDVGIGGGSTEITGQFSPEEAKDLAVLIKGGALPLPVSIIEQRTVGPTLGQDAIDASIEAAIIGLALTGIFITVVYRLVGFLATVALACYALISYAVLVALGATLTLPGLAGFVLAIGMAIDANVLVFERAREEYTERTRTRGPAIADRRRRRAAATGDPAESGAAGSPADASADATPSASGSRRIPGAAAADPFRLDADAPRGESKAGGLNDLPAALRMGFTRAWTAILDSNLTTLLAAGLLFLLASGPVRGFGVTLSVGVLASMISALVIARVLTEWAVRRAFVGRHPRISGLAGNGRLRRWLSESGPDLMRRGRLWLIISAVIVLVSLGGVAVRGLNLGVEFTGGRLLSFTTSTPVSAEQARAAVADAGFERAVVQTSSATGAADKGISVRTEQLTNEEAVQVQKALETVGGKVTKERDELIGPSLGDELRNKALIALVAALGAQLLYLAVRFRWTFGVAAALAMLHDVVAVIGVFAWLGKPIDGIFLAAALTIIGLSVNDTVVVFDRIRELRRARPKDSFASVVNTAVLQTVPRTINTGLGAMFILGALTLLGGDSLTDFALALLIGLVVGTLSSVFTASPLAILFERLWPPDTGVSKPAGKSGKPSPDRDTDERDRWSTVDPYADVPSGREGARAMD